MKAKGCAQCSGIRMKADPCARCSGEPRFVAITEDRIIGLCPRCHANSDEPKRRYEVVSCATLEETMKAWDAMQDEIADTLRPEPKGPSTMPQQQKIVEFYFNAVPGAIDLSMESDADVFAIRDSSTQQENRIALSATVNAEAPGPVESRVYWLAKSGDLLPMEQFVGWRKKYIGSVRHVGGTLHVWEMRDLSMKPLSELFGGGDLNELVRSIEAGDEIDATQYTAEQLGWILSHIGELNEWVEGERRIAELRTSLVASLQK